MENQGVSAIGDLLHYSPTQDSFILSALPVLTCIMSLTNPTFNQDGRKNYSGYQLLSISNLTNPEDMTDTRLQILEHLLSPKNGFNYISQGPVGYFPVEVLICSEQVNTVKQILSDFNIPFDGRSQDFQKNLDEHQFENDKNLVKCGKSMNWRSYQRLDTIQNWMDLMAFKYPDIVAVETFGRSTEGRPLRAMKISTDNDDYCKPVVWLDSGMHGYEWVSVSTVTFMANEIIQRALTGNPDDVINSVTWVIVPNLNPDGYQFTFDVDRLWRKTRSKTNKKGCFGTDLNRNWDFKWGGKESFSDPCSIQYRGPRPASEPEIVFTQKYIYKIKDQIKLFISFHSFSQFLFYPWSYDDVPIEDKDDLEKVANDGVAALKAVHGTSFRVGTVPKLLYRASGSSLDWAKGVANIKFVFTFELRDKGKYEVLLPPNQIIPSGEETLAGLTAMVRSVLKYYQNSK